VVGRFVFVSSSVNRGASGAVAGGAVAGGAVVGGAVVGGAVVGGVAALQMFSQVKLSCSHVESCSFLPPLHSQ
jgi:hypothetical protein